AFRQFAKLVGRGDRIEQGRLQAFRQGNLLKVHIGAAPDQTSFLHQIGYIRQFGGEAALAHEKSHEIVPARSSSSHRNKIFAADPVSVAL
ncbi:hypothetical protein DYH55_19915, partial [Methylovirgula sp. 4M-Z18]|uniref:hypothetical protein n=1 Tax=Methylovirgula sp. 4M-Z18 TaxID=2293567 RepID=UPI000E3B3CAD